tara:strand:+ start:1237 stop:1539 length:303 start_codon:yes stop_codon:yes gene_type:complete
MWQLETEEHKEEVMEIVIKKQEKKKRKTRKKPRKTKKVAKSNPVVVVVIEKKIILPCYQKKIEVNEFNKYKVDYIKKQIYHCKDLQRKLIYENALTKYNI